MKATVINPSRIKKGSAAAKRKMAKVRAARKKSRVVYKGKSSIKKTTKNPSQMRKAHLQMSKLVSELDHRNSVTVTFSKSDKTWMNYILMHI